MKTAAKNTLLYLRNLFIGIIIILLISLVFTVPLKLIEDASGNNLALSIAWGIIFAVGLSIILAYLTTPKQRGGEWDYYLDLSKLRKRGK